MRIIQLLAETDPGGYFRERDSNTFNYRLPGNLLTMLTQSLTAHPHPFLSPSGTAAGSSGCPPLSIPIDPIPMLQRIPKDVSRELLSGTGLPPSVFLGRYEVKSQRKHCFIPSNVLVLAARYWWRSRCPYSKSQHKDRGTNFAKSERSWGS